MLRILNLAIELRYARSRGAPLGLLCSSYEEVCRRPEGSNRESDDPTEDSAITSRREGSEEASTLLHSYNYGRMKQHSRRTQAVVAVSRSEDRLLIIKRAPGVILPGYWTPPSGRIEPGETHEQALIREVEEEFGVKATPIAKVWECPTDDGEFLLH